MKKTITELRQDKNLTQGQLADELGVDIKTVNNWENFRTNVPKTRRKFIAKYFGVSENDIAF